jgi:hypothetical protein
MRRILIIVIPVLFAMGCGSGSSRTVLSTHREEEAPGHSHERDKLMLADLGKRHHAGLTAHLSSKTGNELDIFIETADAAHTSVALPLAKFVAKAKSAEGKEHELIFEPSEPEERQDDPPGKCSHFTAKAPWMKPDELLTVTARIPLDGNTNEVTWEDFSPKKFAHFEE